MTFFSKEGRDVVEGQRVKVYRNLVNGCFSVKDKRTALVAGYTDNLVLSDVKLFVGKGHERAKEQGIRNVHAYADGIIEAFEGSKPEHAREITYNPFKDTHFRYKDDDSPAYIAKNLLVLRQSIYEI